jgi:ketosteroid isomerase-like protein
MALFTSQNTRILDLLEEPKFVEIIILDPLIRDAVFKRSDFLLEKSHELAPSGADAATTAEVRDWLERFAACVRDVDYAAARPFWHPDIVIFGTYQELVKSLTAWTERQWDNVWPRTAEFRFDLENTMIMAASDRAMTVAIAPWTSTGFHEDGTPFDRPGRATIVLARQPDGRWVGVHSHMSLARGVPQDSHGKRAVKAR